MNSDFALRTPMDGIVFNGTPTPQQMEKIKKYELSGFPPLLADELFVVTGIVADNLINRSFGKWSVTALEQMADLIVGVPATLDHDWDSVRKVWGRTFDATVTRTAADSVPQDLLRKAGNYDYNRDICNKEGLVRCQAMAFTSIDDPILEMLRLSKANEISTGGFDFTNVICPTCNVPFGENGCRHYPPSPWRGRDPNDSQEVPYYIRDNLIDIMEWSFVTMPNLPGAGAI